MWNPLSGGEDEEQHCVWYDVCSTDGSLSRYCPVNHTAKEYPTTGLSILKKNCPHLLEHMKDGKLNLCCNPRMVS